MGCMGSMMRMIVIAATIAAIALNVMVYLSCDFLQVKNNPGITFGLFALEVNGGGCVKYEVDGQDYMKGILAQSIAQDPYIRTAQSSIFAAIAFGSWALLVLLLDQYLCPICCAGCFESIGYVGAQVASSLVYFLYMSENCTDSNCAWSQGATYNVTAQALYLGASILAGCMGEKPRETRKNKVQNPDGGQPGDATTTPAAAATAAYPDSFNKGDALETGTVTSGSPNTPSVASPPPTYDSPPYATTY